MAHLASPSYEAFESLGPIATDVSIIMERFYSLFNELVRGTELTHEGIKTRLERFNNKLEQEKECSPVRSSAF